MPPRVHVRSMCRACSQGASVARAVNDATVLTHVVAQVIPWLRTDPALAADTLARHHDRLHNLLVRHPSDVGLRLTLGEIDGLLASIFTRWLRFRRDSSMRGDGLKCEWCRRGLPPDALWTHGSQDHPSRGFCDEECLRASRVADVWRRMQTAERVRQHRMRQRLGAELARASRRGRGDEAARM